MKTVVRIRTLQEQIARGEVARDRAQLARRQHNQMAAVTAVDDASRGTPDNAPALLAHRDMLGGAMREVSAATGRVIEARGSLTDSIGQWSAAAQRLEGVERLEERTATAAMAELERTERVELDDLVVMRWKGEST